MFGAGIKLLKLFFFLDTNKSCRFGLSLQISVLIAKLINNNRMLRWEVQEVTSGDHLIQPLSPQQGQLQQVAQDHIQAGVEYFQDGDSTTCLDKLSQCLITPEVKTFVFLCAGAWSYSSPGAGLGISLCWNWWDSCWPVSPSCWCCSDWSYSHLVCQLVPPVLYQRWLFW